MYQVYANRLDACPPHDGALISKKCRERRATEEEVAADDYLTNKESNCYCLHVVYLLPWVQGSLVPRPFPPPVFDC